MTDVRVVPIDLVRVSGENMRIDPGDVSELADSIREHGILQPLVVAEVDDGFLIVCGHRRLAGARRAGLTEVPAVVREFDSIEERLAAMVVENVHRKHLTPLEEGRAFRRLMESGLTQYEVATSIGKSQFYVQQRLSLLHLPEAIQWKVHKGQLSLNKAVEMSRRPQRERGPDPRDPTSKWEVYYIDRLLKWLEAGNLPFNKPEIITRLRLLRDSLGSLILPEMCDRCGTVTGYISTCCNEHDDRLCVPCFEATHDIPA